ncbi:hypothetical protein GF339_23585 [candidate division KSB3 bacterium]|uniref:Outer membrane lipoprotein BamD-like domain-containing protein n=1 Tax=candidate division KSB3 bacterium TaxID=2044937 RepID=A0A9D5Q973_9BACT|nr:hypothetical protein [candidate division KSB3 bacterium]MBD3327586.1 hypothetical protein [candidate division KSB3 bacterium]
MMQTRRRVLALGVLIILMAGCAASHLNQAKQQYELAQLADNPLPYYKAALEELDDVLAREENQWQAYALKGLIYRQLEDYEQATQHLEIAKQGTFGGQQQWVPVVINLTYGDIFHAQATEAIRSGEWERARDYQNTAIEFFENVISTSFSNFDTEVAAGDELGLSMQELYLTAQARWAAAKYQMAVIGGRIDSKARQSELIREATARLSSLVSTYPDATSLRYYLADGYRKQALTIRRTDPAESERLQEQAMAQLRVCAELGLSRELRNPAAQLFSTLSKGTEPEIEQKILGTIPSR